MVIEKVKSPLIMYHVTYTFFDYQALINQFHNKLWKITSLNLFKDKHTSLETNEW